MSTRRLAFRSATFLASGGHQPPDGSRRMPLAAAGGRQPPDHLRRPAGRRSFTLVELLTVVMVIGILASSVLFALYNATREAKIARTRAQIQRLHQLLMTRWESYRTRPIRISTGNLTPKARLDALRELMRLELPDRIEDVIAPPANGKMPSGLAYPALARHYWNVANASTWKTPNPTHDQAECLYMIIAAIHENGTSGLEFLQPGEIGDVDGDGMPEILDAWGHPIYFLRCAPGYVSRSDIMSTSTPDPFDPLKVYSGTYALYPLIFSGGPDGVPDIAAGISLDYGTTSPPNNPFVSLSPNIGTPLDPPNGESRYMDNITNQNEVK